MVEIQLSDLNEVKEFQSKTPGATISSLLFCLIMSREERIPTSLIAGGGGGSRCYSTVESLRVSQGREWHPPSNGKHINNPAG